MSEIDQIIDMYESGMSLKKIGKVLGRSQQYPYGRLKKIGYKLRPLRGSGPNHSQWKGGRIYAGQGYFRVWLSPKDPMASMRDHHGYVKEHRLVMARKLGRSLLSSETVHHLDGNRGNNSPENLEVRQGLHGKGVVMCCLDCGSKRIAPAEIGGNGVTPSLTTASTIT